MSESNRHSEHTPARRQLRAKVGLRSAVCAGIAHEGRPRAGTALLVFGWAIAVVGGFAFLIAYEYEPGPPAHPPSTWPRNTYVQPDRQRMTLLVFVHPKCPCTSATLSEIGTLLGDVRERPRILTLCLAPGNQPDGWERTALWSKARRIAGETPVSDSDGVVARRFGIRTSGHVLLYDGDGRLRFSGGLTASRGHAGDNHGRSRLEAILNRTDAGVNATGAVEEFPVFGCLLFRDRPPDSP